MMYLNCSLNGGEICENEYHNKTGRKGRKIGTDGFCKVGRAWRKQAVKCTLCPVPVPDHMGMRLNMEVLQAVKQQAVRRPLLRQHQNDDYLLLLEQAANGTDVVVCDLCAEHLSKAVNYKDPRTAGKLYLSKTNRYANLFVAPKTVPVAIVAFATSFEAGEKYRFSKGSPENGTECSLYNNCREFCVCSGLNDWTTMRYQARETADGQINAAPYGEACAKLVETAGFKLFRNYRNFVLELANKRAV